MKVCLSDHYDLRKSDLYQRYWELLVTFTWAWSLSKFTSLEWTLVNELSTKTLNPVTTSLRCLYVKSELLSNFLIGLFEKIFRLACSLKSQHFYTFSKLPKIILIALIHLFHTIRTKARPGFNFSQFCFCCVSSLCGIQIIYFFLISLVLDFLKNVKCYECDDNAQASI